MNSSKGTHGGNMSDPESTALKIPVATLLFEPPIQKQASKQSSQPSFRKSTKNFKLPNSSLNHLIYEYGNGEIDILGKEASLKPVLHKTRISFLGEDPNEDEKSTVFPANLPKRKLTKTKSVKRKFVKPLNMKLDLNELREIRSMLTEAVRKEEFEEINKDKVAGDLKSNKLTEDGVTVDEGKVEENTFVFEDDSAGMH